jgi:hypothetical protein
VKELGKIAYDAYLASTGGVSLVDGAELGKFEDQDPQMQVAWEIAAKAVAAHVLADASRPRFDPRPYPMPPGMDRREPDHGSDLDTPKKSQRQETEDEAWDRLHPPGC